jgi:hypothetical protein
MAIVSSFVQSTGIVKEREQPHHNRIRSRPRGEQKAVLLHSPPMTWAMNGVQDASMVLLHYAFPECIEIDHGMNRD